MSSPIRLIGWGTPIFARDIFAQIAQDGRYVFEAIVTAPDALVGRKKTLTKSPVKQWAEQESISILSPTKIGSQEFQKSLTRYQADMWLVVAYGKILPTKLLEQMPDKVINIHPSLLPQYRGPAPIHQALLQGDECTGVSLIVMDKYMDHGSILAQCRVDIHPTMRYQELSQVLMERSVNLTSNALEQYHQGLIHPTAQNHEKATYVSMIKKSDGQINWSQNADNIYNQYRAYHIWPGVYTYIKGQKVELEIIGTSNTALATGHWKFVEDMILVGTGQGNVIISALKPAGKSWLRPSQFAQRFGVTGIWD